jgi:hypothetical protein
MTSENPPAFPILKRRWNDPKESVPWDAVEPHRAQAQRNHYQTLERLAQRGGLSWSELLAVLQDQGWTKIAEDDARKQVNAMIAARKKGQADE